VDAEIDDRIPDVSGWNVEQLSKYLEEQGYPVQAAVFRDHVSVKIIFNFLD
jgi:beta-lactam-binding protein with PASTA domain